MFHPLLQIVVVVVVAAATVLHHLDAKTIIRWKFQSFQVLVTVLDTCVIYVVIDLQAVIVMDQGKDGFVPLAVLITVLIAFQKMLVVAARAAEVVHRM